MSGVTKFSISLLISVVVFSVLAVLVAVDRFQVIETRFYVPRVERSVQARAERAAQITDSFHESSIAWFREFTLDPSVMATFRINASEAVLRERDQALQAIEEELASLDQVRIIDLTGDQLHYSSDPADYEQTGTRREYQRPDVVSERESIPLSALAEYRETPQTVPSGAGLPPVQIVFDQQSNQFIYRVPAVDSNGLLQGTALFYVNMRDLRIRLVRAALIGTLDDVRVLSEGALIVNAPVQFAQSLVAAVSERWSEITDQETRVSLSPDRETETDALRYEVFSSETSTGRTVLYLEPAGNLEMPLALQYTLVGAVFLTTFLFVFLILNIRQDAVLVLEDRVKRFQINFLREYMQGQSEIDFDRWRAELEERREEANREIRRGIEKLPPEAEARVDELINKTWDDIIGVLSGRAQESNRQSLGESEIERIVQRVAQVMKTTPLTVSAGRVIPNQSEPAEHRGIEAAEVGEELETLDDVDDLEPLEEELEDDGEDEAVVSVSDAEEIQRRRAEYDRLKRLQDENDSGDEETDELDEVEELDEIDEAEEAEEAEEVDALEDEAEDEAELSDDPDEIEASEEMLRLRAEYEQQRATAVDSPQPAETTEELAMPSFSNISLDSFDERAELDWVATSAGVPAVEGVYPSHERPSEVHHEETPSADVPQPAAEEDEPVELLEAEDEDAELLEEADEPADEEAELLEEADEPAELPVADEELETLEAAENGEQLGEPVEAESLSSRRTLSTTFGVGLFGFGRGTTTQVSRLESVPTSSNDEATPSEPADTTPGSDQLGGFSPHQQGEPSDVAELESADDLDEVTELEPPGRGVSGSHGSLVRITHDKTVSTQDYEIATVSEVLNRLHVAKSIFGEYDGVVQIEREAYLSSGGREETSLRNLVDEVFGAEETSGGSGIEELFGGGEDDLFSDFGEESEGGHDLPDILSRTALFRFHDSSFDYDGFLRGFRDDEGGRLKSLVRFTRYFGARAGVILTEQAQEFSPALSIGIEGECRQNLRVSKSSEVSRNILEKSRVLMVFRPLLELEYFHDLCSPQQLSVFERSLFLPITFEGKTAYFCMSLKESVDSIDEALRPVLPIIQSRLVSVS